MIDHSQLKHSCTSIGCGAEFDTKGRTSAHHLMYLHALKTHTISINLACHKNCDYINREH